MGRGREENHRQSQRGEREGEHDKNWGEEKEGETMDNMRKRQRGTNGPMTLKLAGKRHKFQESAERREGGRCQSN